VSRFRVPTWLPRTRKVRFSIAVGAAVALGSVATAVASAQTSDTVTITSVTATTDPGQLVISVTSDTALTALTVTLASASNPDALQLSLANDFTMEPGGSATNGTYELTNPLTMAELPGLGAYTVEVGAVDSGGGTAADGGSSLDWIEQPAITLTANQTTFSYDSPAIVFGGTLSLTYPDGSQDTGSVSGQPLILTNNKDNNTSAITTGFGGAFQATVSRPDSGAAYGASFVSTSTIAGATSDSVDVSAVQDPAQVTANVSATQLRYGQDLTISGTATYNSGQGFVPLADSTIEIFSHPYGTDGITTPFPTASTDAEGNYSVTFADKQGGQWYVYAGGLPGDASIDELLTTAVARTTSVFVAYPVSITSLRGSLSSFAKLTLTGCLNDSNLGKASEVPLEVQYAAKRTGPWHSLGTVEGTTSTLCGTAPDYGSRFSYQVTVAVAAAFYRLAYPGSANYQSAASTAVYEAKTLTKITNFVISRHTVAKNSTVTVSGRLWKDVKGWHPFARQTVFVLFHYKGVWYYFPHKPVTNSAGNFSGTFTAYATAPWIAEYMGSGSYYASATAHVTVRVTGARSAQVLTPAAWLARPFAGEILAGTQIRLAS
jgi:hypothetical protein